MTFAEDLHPLRPSRSDEGGAVPQATTLVTTTLASERELPPELARRHRSLRSVAGRTGHREIPQGCATAPAPCRSMVELPSPTVCESPAVYTGPPIALEHLGLELWRRAPRGLRRQLLDDPVDDERDSHPGRNGAESVPRVERRVVHFFFPPFSRWLKALPAADFAAGEDFGLESTFEALVAAGADVTFFAFAMW